MYIELKKIDKDTLKVGDVVGIARKIGTGYGSIFRHCRIIPAVITRITPKRTKIETDQFGTHGKNEIFYVYDYDAKREDDLADGFCEIRDGVYELYEFKKNGLSRIKDEDIPNMTYHMKAITEILQKYKEK